MSKKKRLKQKQRRRQKYLEQFRGRVSARRHGFPQMLMAETLRWGACEVGDLRILGFQVCTEHWLRQAWVSSFEGNARREALKNIAEEIEIEFAGLKMDRPEAIAILVRRYSEWVHIVERMKAKTDLQMDEYGNPGYEYVVNPTVSAVPHSWMSVEPLSGSKSTIKSSFIASVAKR